MLLGLLPVAGFGDYKPPITVRAFNPTRRDLDDWWLALSWFAALSCLPNPPAGALARPDSNAVPKWTVEQKVVLLRSLDPHYSVQTEALTHLGHQRAEVSSQNLMAMTLQQQFDGLALRATRV